MTETCSFQSGPHHIEGLLTPGDTDKGMIITHPHPLYGGDMNNFVVDVIHRAFHGRGYTTLRFNFRGVGRSQGRYDNGIGEQDDLKAAIEFLSENRINQIELAGYSFGSWVNALAIKDKGPVHRMVMVSPPVAFTDFTSITSIQGLDLVVTGSRDEIAPAAMIQTRISDWNQQANLKIIEGADHFYSGYADQLKAVLVEAL